MRKVFSSLLVGAALLGCTTPAAAQKLLSLGISGGATVPVSDLAESHETGFHVAAYVGIKVPVLPVHARIEGLYSKFGPHAEDIVGVHDGGIRIAGGAVNAVYAFAGAHLRPYVTAGVGIYNQSYIRGSVTDFGVNGGLGATFRLAGLAAFTEARLHRISDDDRQFRFVPITFGIEF